MGDLQELGGASQYTFPTIFSFFSVEAPIVSPLYLLPSVLPTHQSDAKLKTTYFPLPVFQV